MKTHHGSIVRTGLALVALALNSSVIQRAQADSFVNTGSLTNARYHYTATCLPNGQVLVAGGQNSSGNLSSAELYDPDTGTWTATGSMIAVRRNHTATLLPNGKVLVAAGYGTGGYLSSAELYDPDTGTWTATASLPSTRYHHTATLLPNGKVLVAGGYGSGGYLATAVLYDSATGSWTNTGSLAASRRLHTATLLPNGKVLAAGGWGSAGYLSSAELYDPATGIWTTTGAMTTTRYWHTATLLPDGKVLAAGGYGTGGYRASTELYDPATGIWTASGSMDTARYAHRAALLPNGKVLVGGGMNSTNSCLSCATLYDPAAGTWAHCGSMSSGRAHHAAACLPNGTVLMAAGNGVGGALAGAEFFIASAPIPMWNPTDSLNNARTYHTATLLPNGKVLVAGGFDGNVPFNFTGAELYDLATGNGTWIGTGSLGTPREYHTATLLPLGKVLVVGGDNFNGTLQTAELYDPASGGGTWTTVGPLNMARRGHSATLLFDGKVLAAGGDTPLTAASAELYQYDPLTGVGTWSPIADSLNTPRYYHTATLLPNGKVLLAGGYRPWVGIVPNAELYDPATGMWEETDSMSSPRYLHTATLLPNGKVLVAGGDTLASSELFDPASGPNGTWTTVGQAMNAGRYNHTATLLPSGKVLVAGGYYNGHLFSAELYDPSTGNGTWAPTDALEAARYRHTATLLSNGNVVVAGGQGTSGILYNSEVYQDFSALSLAWLFPTIEKESQDYLGNIVPAVRDDSAGSGIAYWSDRNTYLVLDNTVVSGSSPPETRLFEFNRSHVWQRTIKMIGFRDPEDIHWIGDPDNPPDHPNTFVISQEYNTSTSSIDELVVIAVPTSGGSMNIANAKRRASFSLGSGHNKGVEAVTVLGDHLYFAAEYGLPPTAPTTWNVWKVDKTANGPVTPTVAFSLLQLYPNRATDISGLTTDGTYLWFLSQEGISPASRGRVLRMTTNGELIGDYLLPSFTNPVAPWPQAEGIELFADPFDGNRMKIIITGEGPSESGMDFMLLSAP